MWGQGQIIARHFLALSKHTFTSFDIHVKVTQAINTDTGVLQREMGREREEERNNRKTERVKERGRHRKKKQK